jgi:Pyruvate/2-oxoacid:ferredoxin oxidoreductase delta subunit
LESILRGIGMEQGTLNILIPVVAAVIVAGSTLVTWYLNERSKIINDEYMRKGEKYSQLIRSIRGFYIDSSNSETKADFLNQLNLCWMYCPDEVIHKAYNFLSTVHTDRLTDHMCSDEEKEKAMGEFVLAMRKDLVARKPLGKTSLKPEDFQHLRPL